MCLDLFHDSHKDHIFWTCYCRGIERASHPELIDAWSAAVSSLPQALTQLLLDITPAPAARRERHRLAINPFLHDRRTQKFLSFHIDDVGALVTKINTHYNNSVSIVLTGRVSTKSTFFVTALRSVPNVDVEYVGIWLDPLQTRFRRIETAVKRIASKQQVAQCRKRGEEHPFSKLRTVVWSENTRWAYASFADAEEELAVMDFRVLTKLANDPGEYRLEIAPAVALRRRLQHCIAGDLGLFTTSFGNGKDRHVVVTKSA